MADAKKPGVGIIIGMGPKKPMPMDDSEGPEADDGMKDKMGISAMAELAAHLKSGDHAAAWDCFKQAAELADDDEEEGGEEPAEEGEKY